MSGTTGLSAHSVTGRAHVPLRPHLPLRGSRLYILLHLLLARVSIGLAHLEIELCSSITDLLHERDRGPSSEKIPLDSRPPLGGPIKTSFGEEPITMYRPLLIVDHVSPFVFMDLAYV